MIGVLLSKASAGHLLSKLDWTKRLLQSFQMSAKAKEVTETLPREMMQHTYPLLYELEESHWWYVGRRRIIASFVKDICAQIIDRQPRILDVGCGTGANLKTLSEFGDAEGVDVSPDALEFCLERGLTNVKLGAAEDLPYESGTFDLVTALDVVEHLDNDVRGLREDVPRIAAWRTRTYFRAYVHVAVGSAGRSQQSSAQIHAARIAARHG